MFKRWPVALVSGRCVRSQYPICGILAQETEQEAPRSGILENTGEYGSAGEYCDGVLEYWGFPRKQIIQKSRRDDSRGAEQLLRMQRNYHQECWRIWENTG